jgi:hypothetical protein
VNHKDINQRRNNLVSDKDSNQPRSNWVNHKDNNQHRSYLVNDNDSKQPRSNLVKHKDRNQHISNLVNDNDRTVTNFEVTWYTTMEITEIKETC